MSDKTQMVTIEAPVGALIITKQQIEPIFRKMFNAGMSCASLHHTNDDKDEAYFKERLKILLASYA